MKLCLGTCQFGMDYGIRNQKQPKIEDAVSMLDYAVQNGIDAIDTASAYGNAELVVGEFLNRRTIARDKLFISSKVTPNILDEVKPEDYKKVINEQLEKTLKRTSAGYLDSYMFHSSRYAFNEEMLEALYEIKQTGKIRHCGVSVYYPDEAEICINSDKVDFIQLPFSVFDQRMLKEGIFDLAVENGKTEIHSRSAFIQGLVLMHENEVPDFLEEARPVVRKADELCNKYHISRTELAMHFVKHQKAISHLVFGVDNMEQLKENIRLFSREDSEKVIDYVAEEFKNIDTNIMMPSLWVKNRDKKYEHAKI